MLLTNTNLEDDTVNALFEQAVQLALESVSGDGVPSHPERQPGVKL